MVEVKKEKKESPKTNGFVPDFAYLPIWEKKFKVKANEIEIRIKTLMKTFIEKRTNWDQEKCYTKAKLRVHSEIMSKIISTTGDWKIRIDWIKRPFDFNAAKIENAMTLYAKDPRKAIREGIVKEKSDATGTRKTPIALDTRKEFGKGENKKPNKNFGKPLQIRNFQLLMGGIGIPSKSFEAEKWEDMRAVEIKITKSKADPESKDFVGNILMNTWYNTNLINKTDKKETEEWKLNGSASTKFTKTEGAEISEDEMLQYYAPFYCELSGITEYHEAWMEEPDPEKENFNPDKTASYRLVVTKGQVIDIQITAGQNTHLIIDYDAEEKDIGNEEEVMESVHCWVPESIPINFGKYSELLIFGNTSQGKRKDLATGETQEDWALPSINVTGIIILDLVEPEVEDEEAGDEEEDVESEEEEVTVEEPDINDTEDKTEEEDVEEKSEDIEKEEDVEEKSEDIEKEEDVEEKPKKASKPKVESKPKSKEKKVEW